MKHALLLLSLIATQAHAQLIYTDVIPDATYSGTNDSCYLDLDNNGQADFQLYRTEVTNTCFMCVLPLPEQRIMIEDPVEGGGRQDRVDRDVDWERLREVRHDRLHARIVGEPLPHPIDHRG